MAADNELIYEVTGQPDRLEVMKTLFKSMRVEDRFQANCWNVVIHEDDEEKFLDHCVFAEIETKFL